MSENPASPKASRLASLRWLDTRLVLGVLLVLISVVIGARVLSSADQSQLVWAATGDLTIGSELAAGDLEPVRVRLFDNSARYLDAGSPAPIGYVLARGIGRGELLPDEALRKPEVDVDYRSVTVAVEPGHFPPSLRAEQKVDVWVTPRREPGAVAPDPSASPRDPATDGGESGGGAGGVELAGAQLVLQQLTVVTGPSDSQGLGSSTAQPVVVQVRPRDVATLVSAMSLGTLDLVRVPRAVEAGNPLVPAAPGSG